MLRVALANLTPADVRFLTELIAIFADPAHAEDLKRLRSDEISLGYGPDGHAVPRPANLFFSNN